MSEISFRNESGKTLSGPKGMIAPLERATVPKEYYDWYVSMGWAPERKVKPTGKKANAKDKKAVDNVPSFLG